MELKHTSVQYALFAAYIV